MALYEDALLRLLPENATSPWIDPTTLIYHSIVGPGSAGYSYFLYGTNLVSTYINPRSDEPNGNKGWQLMGTNRQADANYHANGFANSVESGDHGQPDTQPWDPGQVRRNIELGIWETNTHPKIRRIRCTAWNTGGIGFHSMFGAPSPWTPARGKTCPGKARILQFERQILPAILAESPPGTTYVPPEETMTHAQEAKLSAVAEAVAELSQQIGGIPSKPVALRMPATAHGKTKGEVWVVGPFGCFHIQRSALNLLLITGQVIEKTDPVHPDYLVSMPLLDPALTIAA